MRIGPGAARTILLLHIISARPSKQPLMVRTFLKVYMELGSYFVSARTNKDIIIRCAQLLVILDTHCISRSDPSPLIPIPEVHMRETSPLFPWAGPA